MKISPPPTFSSPSPLTGSEGFWVDKGKNKYMPVVSKRVWKDKKLFLDAVEALEKQIISFGSSSHLYKRIRYKGLASSRLEKDVYVGNAEYYDNSKGIVWPSGFADYYIGKWNVMPTKRFYEYVMYRMKYPLPAAPPPPPRQKILNPITKRYILLEGKVAKKLIGEDYDRYRDKKPTNGLYKYLFA